MVSRDNRQQQAKVELKPAILRLIEPWSRLINHLALFGWTEFALGGQLLETLTDENCSQSFDRGI